MHDGPISTTPAATGSAADEAGATATQPPVSRAHLWAQRMFLLTFVFLCSVLGMSLVWLPWSNSWAQNLLFARFPWLHEFFVHPFVRGVVSGLGLLDVWIGVHEAVLYHEGP